ncbi:MAG: uroporphyrin-III C-methyltransferase/precorrin-2 dehydrogenase/sirohydrochlorin ferrochelatase, partial [Halioglobus sp.]
MIGGGTIGTRKARLLLKAGAALTVVAPEISDELKLALAEHDGVWHQSKFEPSDLQNAKLIVAATPQAKVNAEISARAQALSILVNVVDSPELCTFIFPSIVDRSPLLIAISSSGRSPVLARLLRRKIEAMVPAAYGQLAEFAGRMRDVVKDKIINESPRRLFWEQ